MVRYDYPLKEKINMPECVLALGFFDGVHIAHRDLIARAKKTALAKDMRFGIFTFASDGIIKKDVPRLYNDDEKAEIFEALGADFAIFADFSAISGMSPKEFVADLLCSELGCRVAVAGFNFRFGKFASGNADDLTEIMSDAGGDAIICEEILADDGESLSATLIRRLITEGEIKRANSLLGSPYNIKGRVLHGNKVGRKLGFPTANIEIEEGRIIPALGVYASAIPIDGKIYLGVTNVGKCPTFEERRIHLETNIIDFSGDLYDREISVYLLDYLRGEAVFSSADELIRQIDIDKNKTIFEFGEITWQDVGLK